MYECILVDRGDRVRVREREHTRLVNRAVVGVGVGGNSDTTYPFIPERRRRPTRSAAKSSPIHRTRGFLGLFIEFETTYRTLYY